MTIVFIGKFQSVYDEEPIAQAFEENGVRVVRLEESRYLHKEYLAIIKTEKPDFVLFTKLQTREHGPDLINAIRELDIPTVSWTFDLLIGHPPREPVVKSFHWLWADYAFLTDGGHVKEYKDIGVNKILLRQGIPEEYCYMEKENEKYPIMFVGTHNPSFPYRQKMIAQLKARYGDKFFWYGNERDNVYRGHDLNKLVSKTRVMIGDSMYSPDYWSNRVYEMCGRGAFLITPRVPGLEKEYTYYKHLVPYDLHDFDGLFEKIDYFLEHKKERDKIRKAAHEYTKKHYLYKHRVKKLLELYEASQRTKR